MGTLVLSDVVSFLIKNNVRITEYYLDWYR